MRGIAVVFSSQVAGWQGSAYPDLCKVEERPLLASSGVPTFTDHEEEILCRELSVSRGAAKDAAHSPCRPDRELAAVHIETSARNECKTVYTENSAS